MKYFESESVETFVENLKEFKLNATQVSSGRFFCKRQSLSLPFMEISSWLMQTSMLYHGNIADDYFLLSFPVQRRFQNVDGKVLGEHSILAILPEDETVVLHPSEVKSLDFVIDKKLFLHHFNWQEIDKLYNLIRSLRSLGELPEEKIEQSKKLVQFALNAVQNANRYNYQSMLDIRDAIVTLLFDFLDHSQVDTKAIIPPKQRLAVVNRALKSIHDSPGENFTVLELSKRCFCSVRTLEYSFKVTLGFTPKEYLIKQRLNMIKRQIQNCSDKSIKSIAMDFGVVNAGRFAKDYYRFFGEYPLETRHKSI